MPLTDSTASATATVNAPAADVFDFICRPANHSIISGDGTVQDRISGPDRLTAGSTFRMKMKMGIPYRIGVKVKEYEADRLIAWAHFGGHRWRWEIEAIDDSSCTVTETYDQSTAKFPPALKAAGYPKRHVSNVEQSVENVAKHFA